MWSPHYSDLGFNEYSINEYEFYLTTSQAGLQSQLELVIDIVHKTKTIMRNILVIFIILLFFNTSKADFIEGQALFVTAHSGLKLRSAPIVGKTIEVIPFGSEVTFISHKEGEPKGHEIDWVKGNWIEVEYDGLEGFVFDGFLTSLPIPMHDFELNQIDMGLLYPLESWILYHFVLNPSEMDTLTSNNGYAKVSIDFDQGSWSKQNKKNVFKAELILNHGRIMDVYHILLAMYEDPAKKAIFENKTIFIKNNDGEIDNIKIASDELITIRKLTDGKLRVRILTSERGCI